MGFISDKDRHARAAQLVIEATEEQKVRPILITEIEKVARTVVEQATRHYRKGKEVDYICSSSRDNEQLNKLRYAAIRLHGKEPSLLVDTVNRVLGMQHGKDYDLLGLEEAVSAWTDYADYDQHYAAEICLRVRFTLPLL